METPLLRTGFRRAIATSHAPSKRRALTQQQRRWLATPTESSSSTTQEPIRAASPIRFTKNRNQFARDGSNDRPRSRSQILPNSDPSTSSGGRNTNALLLRRIRILPASPSYFTATPRYTDDLLSLAALLRKHQLLPQVPASNAPRVAWKTYQQYKSEVDEPVRITRYNRLLELVKRLNYIHPALMPAEVSTALDRFKRTLQPFLNKPKPILIDSYGRARAAGRRKSSNASVYVVEGDGQCMVNGRSLSEYFGRLHDRESAVWALKATERLHRYNVWATVQGGGTTGQAEALMLGCAKALMAHEPGLKPALRRGMSFLMVAEDLRGWVLMNCSQLDVSPATQGRWRGRSRASSRRARCRLGSSVNHRTVYRNLYYHIPKIVVSHTVRHEAVLVRSRVNPTHTLGKRSKASPGHSCASAVPPPHPPHPNAVNLPNHPIAPSCSFTNTRLRSSLRTLTTHSNFFGLMLNPSV